MDYEQKYKSALEWMRSIYPTMQGADKEDAEHHFPELRESEDEQHCKWILEYLYDGLRKSDEQFKDQFKSAIAWLEKQGEKKPVEQDTEIHDLWVYIREWNDKFGRLPKDEDELASCIDYVMKRQKPSDKIEPKFKVGDWVRAISSGNIFKILSVNDGLYHVLCYDGVEANYPIEDVDYDLAYWTIQDAKEGDVLMAKAPFIFNGNLEGGIGCPGAHCGINTLGKFQIPKYQEHWTGHTTTPATKEQRDILFQKMKEAGYEWDGEKKELRKIVQKPTWSEQHIADVFEKVGLARIVREQGNDQLTNAVQSAMIELSKQQKSWSEEDEKQIRQIERIVKDSGASENLQNKISNWLKSLKPNHWKPSEEQIEALNAINNFGELSYIGQGGILVRLYNDLKNL